MHDDLALFDGPEPLTPEPKDSPGVSRTKRQAAMLAAGRHPLSAVLTRPLRLHAQAAPADDRRAPGRRCGNCRFRTKNHRGFPKCGFGDGVRVSHGEATDCRAFWSGCVDHEWKESARA